MRHETDKQPGIHQIKLLIIKGQTVGIKDISNLESDVQMARFGMLLSIGNNGRVVIKPSYSYISLLLIPFLDECHCPSSRTTSQIKHILYTLIFLLSQFRQRTSHSLCQKR